VARRIFYSALLGAALVAMCSSTPAGATGYWNLPSSFCQCTGYGCGTGYHAPLVLGPIDWDGWCAPNEIRLTYPPSPPSGWAGCGRCGDDIAAPTMLEPTPAAPAVEPVSRRHRPLFLR